MPGNFLKWEQRAGTKRQALSSMPTLADIPFLIHVLYNRQSLHTYTDTLQQPTSEKCTGCCKKNTIILNMPLVVKNGAWP